MSFNRRPQFSVWVFLPDGTYYALVRHVTVEEAVAMAHAFMNDAPGHAVRVAITDGGDCIAHEWRLEHVA